MSTERIPCPWCGSTDIQQSWDEYGETAQRCENCGAQGPAVPKPKKYQEADFTMDTLIASIAADKEDLAKTIELWNDLGAVRKGPSSKVELFVYRPGVYITKEMYDELEAMVALGDEEDARHMILDELTRQFDDDPAEHRAQIVEQKTLHVRFTESKPAFEVRDGELVYPIVANELDDGS